MKSATQRYNELRRIIWIDGLSFSIVWYLRMAFNAVHRILQKSGNYIKKDLQNAK